MRLSTFIFGVLCIVASAFLAGCRGNVGGYPFEFVPTHMLRIDPLAPALPAAAPYARAASAGDDSKSPQPSEPTRSP